MLTGEAYVPSNNEQQCAGSLIMMEKLGLPTSLMQVMGRMGLYDPAQLLPVHDLVVEPSEELKASLERRF